MDGYNHNQDDDGDTSMVTPGLLGNADTQLLPSGSRGRLQKLMTCGVMHGLGT